MDWRDLDPTALFETIRAEAPPSDAESMVWAFEQLLNTARVDPGLLDHLAAAAVCAVAYRDRDTPRGVAEKLFRRAISDEVWQRQYEPLIPAPRR